MPLRERLHKSPLLTGVSAVLLGVAFVAFYRLGGFLGGMHNEASEPLAALTMAGVDAKLDRILKLLVDEKDAAAADSTLQTQPRQGGRGRAPVREPRAETAKEELKPLKTEKAPAAKPQGKFPPAPIWLADSGKAMMWCPLWSTHLAAKPEPRLKAIVDVEFLHEQYTTVSMAAAGCQQHHKVLCTQEQIAGAVVLDYTNCNFGFIQNVFSSSRVVMPQGVSAQCEDQGVNKRCINLRPSQTVEVAGAYCCPKPKSPPFLTRCNPYRNEFPEVLAAAALMLAIPIFHRHHVPIWLGGGSLLATIRDRSMAFCNDDNGSQEDLDLFAFLDDFCTLHAPQSELHAELRRAGLYVGRHETGYHDSIWVNKDNTLGLDFGHAQYDRDQSHEVHMDIAWVQKTGEDYLLGHKPWMKTCVNFFDSREQIDYGVDMFRMKMQIPSHPARFLRATYGLHWRRKGATKSTEERDELPSGCRFYHNDV